jgi:hypothetical protein
MLAGVDDGEARGVRLDQVVGLLLAVVALGFGIGPLFDNSFLTHLSTGRLILDGGSIPSADPYSFTAYGTPWTVQSWGASVIYAGVEDLVGLVGIRVLVGLCCAAIAWFAWRLTEPADSLVARLAIVAPAVGIGASLWVERPLTFSLLLLLAVLYALEGRLAPAWMVAVLWLWVNLHGSYPIGLVAIGCYGVGRLLDREPVRREAEVLGWAVAGTLLGGLLSPVGPRLLTFPFQLLSRRDAFDRIVEWQPPSWGTTGELLFAVQLALVVVLVLWRGRRWRNVLPLVVFGALALQSTRNIAHASLVLLPVVTSAVVGLGGLRADRRMPLLAPVRVAVLALGAIVVLSALRGPDVALGGYPEEAITWMEDEGMLGIDARVVSRDYVGNYLHARYGPDEIRVFIDDRVDMYPLSLIQGYNELLDAEGGHVEVLEQAEATAVLWDADADLGRWLEGPDTGWTIVHRADGWLVAVPDEG